jgi:hypothetical protein
MEDQKQTQRPTLSSTSYLSSSSSSSSSSMTTTVSSMDDASPDDWGYFVTADHQSTDMRQPNNVFQQIRAGGFSSDTSFSQTMMGWPSVPL